MKDKIDLFYDNKLKIEQVWDLLKVVRQLLVDVVDENDTTLDDSHRLCEILTKVDAELYELYDLNIKKHKE